MRRSAGRLGLLSIRTCCPESTENGKMHFRIWRQHHFSGYPAWYAVKLGRSYCTAGRYPEAVRLFKQVLMRAQKGEFPLWLAHSHLAVTYSMMGQTEKAQFHLAETIRLNPAYSLELVRKINFYKNPKDLEAVFDALRKAGLPDKKGFTKTPLRS